MKTKIDIRDRRHHLSCRLDCPVATRLRLSKRIMTITALAAFACLLRPTITGHSFDAAGRSLESPAMKQASESTAVATAPPMTAADIEAFLDGLIPVQLQRDDIAGAVVAVVKDGQMIFAKGYGYADVASKKPVSPEGTLFRPGSISKLFTWTSIMQLVEQGKLDLDRDVNDYLDFGVPPAFGKPITLRNIMTHTSGFEETVTDLFVPDAKDLMPLRTYLVAHMPRRIFAPGVTPAYSNYATALAGYIVQRASGQPFEQYVATHIFQPLNMQRITFVQPLPAALQPLMSSGYDLASQGAKKFEFVGAFPAGSVATTASDITHFMIAHLQDGRYGDTQILRPETAQLMHTRQFAADARLNGMCLGFYEETRNGHRIIGHGGDTQYFHSDLHLVLDSNLGFFISQNSAGKGDASLRGIVWQKFMDRYFPYSPPANAPVVSAAQDARAVSGYYLSSRRFETKVLAVANPFGELKVYTNSDGTISADAFKDLNGQPRHFREVTPLEYRDVDGPSRLAFHRDALGRLEASIDYPFMVFQRVPLPENKVVNLVIIGFSVGVLALTIVLWPVAALVRWHYGRKLDLTPGARRLRLLVRLVCVVDIAFLLAWVGLSAGLNDPGAVNDRLRPWIHLIQIVGVLGAVGSLVPLLNVFRVWQHRWWWAKVHDVTILVACTGFVWFILHWHLLNFDLNF